MMRTAASHSGFTLIEILVVMAIITVMLSVTVLRLEGSDASRVKHAAESLGLALEKARDTATISGHSIAFSSDGRAYQFWQSTQNLGEWAVNKADGLEAHALNEKVHITDLRINAKSRPLGERLVFSPDGVSDSFDIFLQAGQSRVRVSMDVMGRIEIQNVSI